MMRRVQLMSANTKANWCKMRFQQIEIERVWLEGLFLFFYDEKNPYRVKNANRMNKRWLCCELEDIPNGHAYKVSRIVLKCVGHKGEVMTTHFFCQCQRVNSNDYKEVLAMIIRPGIESMSKDRPWVHHLIISRRHRKEFYNVYNHVPPMAL